MRPSAGTARTGITRPGGAGPLGSRHVSRIGYGAMQLDTAQFYGNGFVNELIRDVLRPGDGVTVVSRVGAVPDPNTLYPRLASSACRTPTAS